MKRARRFPDASGLVRWTSLCVCFALVLSCLAIVPFTSVTGKSRGKRGGSPTGEPGTSPTVREGSQSGQGNGQGRRVNAAPPQPGPPAGTLPNLDEMRRVTDDARRNGARPVRAPQPIPSTQRKWRHGQPAQRASADPKSAGVKANHARGPIVEPQGGSDTAMARLDPRNRTGTGGVDLLSNNFNWSLGLAGLKGRGLDLGLALAYNSLSPWTQSGGNYIAFDMDQGTPSPGFRLGFPVVQGPYYNNLAGSYFYILITPSGQHVELRQISTYVYQAVDASYSQLTVNASMIFRAGGAQLTFAANPSNTEYHCTEVKDRNGNYLTINYQGTEDIRTVTDTLGRVITFNYDGNGNIQSITQPWNGQSPPHQWATFGWGTTPIGNNIFSSSMTYAGPTQGTSIPVITWVGLPDGSKYYFDYDGSYGVVTKIRYHAYSGNERRQTTYTTSFTTTDSPRVTAERDWAASWNGDTDETPASGEEAVTTFAHDGDGGCRVTLPDGTVQKEYYGSGWQSGLTTETRSYATVADANANSWKKRTTTAWTQENPSVSYLTNPRVTETNIYDSDGNRKRTTIDYGCCYVAFSLPYVITEYAADAVTVLRSTWFDYNLSQQYIDRRIIGLVMWVHVAGTNGFESKTVYDYDNSSIDSQATTAPQHDPAYSSSFTARANVTGVSRWDVTDIGNAAKAHFNQMTYDAAGSVLSTTDPLGHPTRIEYSSSFAYAYPTTVKDPDWNASSAPNNYSTAQYNFDTGAVTQTQGPPPAGQSTGAIQNMAYDSVGRLQWITRPDGFWRFVAYADRGDAVMSQVSIAAYPTSAWSITVVDGADRTRLVGHDLPNSTGGYAGAFTLYDNIGRPSQQSNVEETNASWAPVGDDAAGWIWTSQTYDWKSRPLVTTHVTDGTTKYAEYGGCGCAGGEVVTLTDEVGHKQKVYSDPLGRAFKTEVLNWNLSVYSTTTSTLNARDQVTQVRQTDNATGVYQDTTMSYDAYGRLQSKHVPEQNAGTATTYSYNNDDTLNSVTDARGASAAYGYNNNRHLVNTITYSAPAGVATTPNVTFQYDPAGNRTSASSSTGTSTFVYDQLSRLSSETYQFSDLTGSYTLNYGYNLGGELTSLSIPFTSQSIGYNYDSTGRLTSMTGSGFTASYTTPWPAMQTYTQSLPNFISSIAYRAWGAPKTVTYGNTVSESFSYNSRLQPTSYTLGNVSYTNTDVYPNQSFTSMGWSYDYYADGRVHHAYDSTWNVWDRSYSYDHVGRLAEANTNRVAHGQSWDFYHPDPYKQTSTYDVWNNLKLTGYQYSFPQNDSATYTNNRRSDSSYDADGNVTTNPSNQNTLDVAAQSVHAASLAQVGDGSTQWPRQPASDIAQTYDADGRPAKRTQITRQNSYDPDTGEFFAVDQDTLTSHYIYSTVLGARVVEIDGSGNANVWVYAAGQRIATAIAGSYGNTTFEHHNPVTFSRVTTNAHTSSRAAARDERDPQTGPVPLANPGGAFTAAQNWNQPLAFIGGDPSDFAPGVTLDGMPVSRADLNRMLGNGSAGGGIFFNGKQIGFIDLSHGLQNLTHITVGFDVFRSATPHRNPDFWRYLFSFAVDFALPNPTGHESGHGIGSPQNTTPTDKLIAHARELHDQPNRNDCLTLVDLLRTAGGLFRSVIEATGALGYVLTGSDSAYELAIRQGIDDMSQPIVSFGNNGFRTEFAGVPGDNQLRHFMGGLLVGESIGAANGLPRMNARERGNGVNEVADRNLNGISLPLGDSLRMHNAEYGLNPGLVHSQKLNEVADEVRRKVCNP